MAAPTSPYCESADVAALLPNLLNQASDFSISTTPTKTAVENLISKWANRVDLAFAAVGYYVPFQEIDDEDWADWQTGVLLLMNAVAVAGALTGPIMKPAPAIGNRQGSTDNPFTAEFKELVGEIKETGLGFRAAARVGTRAEEFISAPIGPMTDYLMGYVDRSQWATTGEYTAAVEIVRRRYQVSGMRWAWDHLAEWRRELIGI